MKKRLALLLCTILLAAVLSSCSGGGFAADSAVQSVDVDLTTMSATMVYSEVYNMMTEPDNYVGKVVKMRGSFTAFEDSSNGNVYYACIIADATACCQQGMEFVPAEDLQYPDDFPKENDAVMIVGTFEEYYEGDRMFVHLTDCQMTEI